MLTFIVIAAIIIFVLIVYQSSSSKNKQLMSEGKIIERNDRYWENAEIFATKATYEDVLKAIESIDLSDCGTTIYKNVDGKQRVLFKSTHEWNAIIDYQGTQEAKNIFQFSFAAWKTSGYGFPTGMQTMNVMLTSVEKMFLSLDPDTTVEKHPLQLKTKRKL